MGMTKHDEPQAQTWRDALSVHSAAECMPLMSEAGFGEAREKHGMRRAWTGGCHDRWAF
jgi:hypothetical protein